MILLASMNPPNYSVEQNVLINLIFSTIAILNIIILFWSIVELIVGIISMIVFRKNLIGKTTAILRIKEAAIGFILTIIISITAGFLRSILYPL